jgi:hypothetical protein
MYTFCAYSERADEMTVPHKETGWRVLWARARAPAHVRNHQPSAVPVRPFAMTNLDLRIPEVTEAELRL